MNVGRDQTVDGPEWFFFSGGPGAPRYGDDPTKHAVDHDTETFVREVLQNANDQGLDNDDPVEVTFRFVTLSGEDKRSFLKALGWEEELQSRIQSVSDSNEGRSYGGLLDRVQDPDAEIRLLIVEDRNTTGLTGDWDGDSNYAALVRDELYSSKQEDTAGGSYGIGKSVLWTFSDASTVVFNSYPNGSERDSDSPRLIGRTKLPTHELPGDDTTYQGAGWLCRPATTEDGVRPLSVRGSVASDLAERLHVSRPAVSGTSAMVVEFQDPTRDERPDVDELATEVVEAAVKYFWPAIYNGDLEVTVETPDAVLDAGVDTVPQIRPFVQCYTNRVNQENSLDNPGDVASLDIPLDIPPRADGSETPDGGVMLSARLASPADDDTYLNNVALFRGTGMVVKYYDQSRVAYGDRNFHAVLAAGEARTDGEPTEADREIDRFLRFAEPPEHDEWESTENLRNQYKRGFRTALDDMFGTLRDGLRHLLSQSTGAGDTLSDRVLKKFPIHGDGNPRFDGEIPSRMFDIETTSHFDGDRWQLEGSIATVEDEAVCVGVDVSMTAIGEDGSRFEDVPIDSLEVENDDATVTRDEETVRFVVDTPVNEVAFSGRSELVDDSDFLSGKVGETQLTIQAELYESDEGTA